MLINVYVLAVKAQRNLATTKIMRAQEQVLILVYVFTAKPQAQCRSNKDYGCLPKRAFRNDFMRVPMHRSGHMHQFAQTF